MNNKLDDFEINLIELIFIILFRININLSLRYKTIKYFKIIRKIKLTDFGISKIII